MVSIMEIREGDLDTPEKRGKYTVSVVGCGRIGLPTACLFAEAGFRVIGVDSNLKTVNLIRQGRPPFAEPGLEDLLQRHVSNGRLTATTDTCWAASMSDIIALTLPTPVDEKGKPDYGHVEDACRRVGMGLKPGSLVLLESTIGPGVTETLVRGVLEEASGLHAGVDFGLAYSPVRASPGRILRDIATYPRVVGAINQRSLEVACLVLETFVKGGPVRVSNIKTAEAVKLFENIYRDVNIALANEFALLCEALGIDFLEAQRAANTQPYCHLLVPGLVGGHIPKDPYLLVEEAEGLNVKLRLTLLGRRINDGMVTHAVRLIRAGLKACGKTIRRSRISILGVSYRANVKEERGSKVKRILSMLSKRGASVSVYDPLFSPDELTELGYPAKRTLGEAVRGVDCIFISVGHDQFRQLNLKRVRFLARMPAAIVDFGHVLDPSRVEAEGFVYRGVGRGVWSR